MEVAVEVAVEVVVEGVVVVECVVVQVRPPLRRSGLASRIRVSLGRQNGAGPVRRAQRQAQVGPYHHARLRRPPKWD